MASLLKKVGLNTLGFVGGKLAAAAAGILLLRALQPAAAGVYGAALGFAALFQSLSDMGLEAALARTVSRDPDGASRWWSAALILDGLQTLAVAAALALFLGLGGSGPIPAELVAVAYVGTRLVGLGMPTGAVLQALDRFDLQSILTTTVSLLNALALALLLAFGHVSALAALLATLASGLLGAVLWTLAARRVGLHWVRVEPGRLAAFWRESLPFALTSVANLLYLRVDQVILAWMVGAAALGYYVAAVKVSDLLVPTLVALFSPLFVHLSALTVRMESGDPLALQAARTSLGRALRYMTALSLPIGVGGSVLAVPLTRWLYGAPFAPSAYALGCMVWVPALIGIHGGLSNALNAAGQTLVLARFLVLNLVLNVALNLWLIPRWGFLASAAISVLGEALRLGMAWVLCRRAGLAPAAGRSLWPALPAALLMGAGLAVATPRLLCLGRWQVPSLVVVGMLGYALLLLGLGFIGPDERALWARLRGVKV